MELFVMVDKIKNHSSLLTAVSQASPDTKTLRRSFQQLSSGLRVHEALKGSAAPENSERARKPEKVEKLVNELSDAVSFSSKALRSLERIAEEGKSSDAELASVEGLARSLDGLREEMDGMLKVLQSRADTAEVVQENYTAADSRIEDVESARAKAVDANTKIRFNGSNMADVHDGLIPERVARLLAE